MREIILDTETTGLDPREDRVIEIGGVELDNRFPTGRTFHVYVNAQGRPVHPDALAVHGISDADLVGKPTFPEIVDQFTAFIDGARLVAHNAAFDMGFINAEFDRLGRPPVEPVRVVDTLALARRKHPMGPNSHDALWRRYESAVATAGELQETLLAAAAENGDFDPATAGEEALTAMLAAKTTPYIGPPWRQTVPLVLIDTDYEPFTTRPRADGRVIFLRPAQEHDYLVSLAEAGLVQYLIADRV